MSKKISVDVILKAEFYDVDSMKVVWHGNYIRFYEQARCVLLDKIGYNYNEMEQRGIAWPVVKLDVKYMKPIQFSQEFKVTATLEEYENMLKISYRIYSLEDDELLNKGTTTQMAVDMRNRQSLLASPAHFILMVEECMEKEAILQ